MARERMRAAGESNGKRHFRIAFAKELLDVESGGTSGGAAAADAPHFEHDLARIARGPSHRAFWARRVTPPAGAHAIELSVTHVRIADLEFERSAQRGPFVPELSTMRHICYSEGFLSIVDMVGHSLLVGAPPLLVGDAGSAKTTAYMVIAGLLGHPIARLVLSRDSDQGDVAGRHVPADGGGFRFVPGLPVIAAENGWLLIMDELSLCPTNVLERSNSLMEDPPSFVLTEHDGRVITPKPGFLLCGATNATDSVMGRHPLSSAFLSRWNQRFVPAPSEVDIAAQIMLRVAGQQPDVELRGRKYVAWYQEPTHEEVGGLAKVDEFVRAVAHAHVTLRAALDQKEELGDEEVVITPRHLKRVLDHMTVMRRPGDDAMSLARESVPRFYAETFRTEKGRRFAARVLAMHDLCDFSSFSGLRGRAGRRKSDSERGGG